MTIRKEERVTGAECLQVICHTCHTKLGATILYNLHKGYSHDGDKLRLVNGEEKSVATGIAHQHDRQHPDHDIQMIYFQALSEDDKASAAWKAVVLRSAGKKK